MQLDMHSCAWDVHEFFVYDPFSIQKRAFNHSAIILVPVSYICLDVFLTTYIEHTVSSNGHPLWHRVGCSVFGVVTDHKSHQGGSLSNHS